jgi:hypothetical protein
MKRALILGNSEYADARLSRLKAPAEDVAALARLLKDPAIGGFDEVETLQNRPCQEVSLAIAKHFGKRRSSDTLFLYFSGHGVRDENGRLFLAVADTNQEYLRQTAIPSTLIEEEMDNCISDTQILVLDCCHSGAFGRGAKASLDESLGVVNAFAGNGSGRVILTATDALQYAWEGDQVLGETPHSVFTHFLIEGLETGAADRNNDGVITLEELYKYAYDKVRQSGSKQNPQRSNQNQQGEIILAKNPYRKIEATALPPDLLHSLSSPYANTRAGALKDLEGLAAGTQGEGLKAAALRKIRDMSEENQRLATQAQEALRRLEPGARPPENGAPKPVRRQTAKPPKNPPTNLRTGPGQDGKKRNPPPPRSGPESVSETRSEPERNPAGISKTGGGSALGMFVVLGWIFLKFGWPWLSAKFKPDPTPPAPVHGALYLHLPRPHKDSLFRSLEIPEPAKDSGYRSMTFRPPGISDSAYLHSLGLHIRDQSKRIDSLHKQDATPIRKLRG